MSCNASPRHFEIVIVRKINDDDKKKNIFVITYQVSCYFMLIFFTIDKMITGIIIRVVIGSTTLNIILWKHCNGIWAGTRTTH